jgi:hypothetical protein
MRFEKDEIYGVSLLEVKLSQLLSLVIGLFPLHHSRNLKYSSRKACFFSASAADFRLQFGKPPICKELVRLMYSEFSDGNRLYHITFLSALCWSN